MSKKEQVLVIEPPIGLLLSWCNMICFNVNISVDYSVTIFQYLNFLELTFTGPFTSAVSSYMKLKNPSDKKVPILEMWNFVLTKMIPGVLQDQDDSTQEVLREAQLWGGRPKQWGSDRLQPFE